MYSPLESTFCLGLAHGPEVVTYIKCHHLESFIHELSDTTSCTSIFHWCSQRDWSPQTRSQWSSYWGRRNWAHASTQTGLSMAAWYVAQRESRIRCLLLTHSQAPFSGRTELHRLHVDYTVRKRNSQQSTESTNTLLHKAWSGRHLQPRKGRQKKAQREKTFMDLKNITERKRICKEKIKKR